MTNDTPTPESTAPSTAASPAALPSDATGATENLGGTAATATATLPPAATATLPSATTATLPPVGPEAAPAAAAASVPTYPAYQAPAASQQPVALAPAPAPQPAQLYPPQRKTNILGVVTLVLGILGFGVIPVVTGHIALSQIKKSGEDGRGLTLAGLILGYVTVAGWLLVVAFWVALAGFAFVGAAYNSF